jgi:AcrR family transcriptional regulator
LNSVLRLNSPFLSVRSLPSRKSSDPGPAGSTSWYAVTTRPLSHASSFEATRPLISTGALGAPWNRSATSSETRVAALDCSAELTPAVTASASMADAATVNAFFMSPFSVLPARYITDSNITVMPPPVKTKAALGRPRTGTKGMPRAEREAQLLDVGERLFATRGYRAVSMDEIALEAGVTKPIIYAYFGSKDAFYAAGIRRAYDECAARVEAAAAGGGAPGDRIWRVIQAVFGWVEEYRGHMPMVTGVDVGSAGAAAARSREEMVTVIAGVLRGVIDDPAAEDELEPMAEVSVAVNMALAERWARHPEEPRELQEVRAMAVLWPPLAAQLERGPR